MREHLPAIFLLTAIMLAVAARILMEKLLRTKERNRRFGIAAGLFLLYTMGQLLLLYHIYYNMLETDSGVWEYHQMTVAVILILNLVVFLAGCFFYAIGGKHKLSDLEKMKLQDM